MTESSGVTAEQEAGDWNAPAISDGVPERCLQCTIRADWGHFRRIDRTVTKQTYRIPPRTTIAGLLAAIAGLDRDSYYDAFSLDRSAIGIEVLEPVRTMTMPSLGLGTNPSETFERAGGTGQKTVQVEYPDSTTNRQIHSYEYLVDPAYRLSIATEDQAVYEALATHLAGGTSHYTPSMGLSELLASVTTPDSVETAVGPLDDGGNSVTVASAIPDATDAVVPQPGQTQHVERVPAAMAADASGRWTTDYADYAFAGGESVEAAPAELSLGTVEDRPIAFY